MSSDTRTHRLSDMTWPEVTVSGPGSSTQTISATDVMWRFFLGHPLHVGR